jgi:hypothetical protein
MVSFAFRSASHAARCVACHGVRSHAVAVALVGDYSMVSLMNAELQRFRDAVRFSRLLGRPPLTS